MKFHWDKGSYYLLGNTKRKPAYRVDCLLDKKNGYPKVVPTVCQLSVFYHRATHCGHRTGREDELIRFGVGRAEKAVDNALGGANAAVGQAGSMQR